MELTIYDIIQGPVVSDKAYKQNQALQKLVLEVHMQANKPLVQEAIEKLIRKGKRRMTKARVTTTDKTRKRAIVTLKEGYNINLFGDVATQAGASSSEPVDKK